MKLMLENVRCEAGEFRLFLNVTFGGRATGIFGRSGAGKTTVLEIVAGLRRPQAGRVLLGDTVLTDVAAGVHVKPEARHIGYVPQDGALFPHLNVRQNLRYGERGGAAARDGMSFEQVCAVLDIAGLVDRGIAGLSGGERQRVALARAVLAKPKLLILDEPLANLDAARKAAIVPYLQRIRSRLGVPLLYVSHAADEMVALCDDVLVLEQGSAVAQGLPTALFERTEEPHFKLRE